MKLPDNQHLAQITKRLRTSSAVVPALIFTAIAVPAGVTGLIVGAPSLSGFFQALIGMPIALTALQIVFFTLFDRDRLQNEEHIERKMLLSGLRPQLGDSQSTIDLSSEEKLVENPALGKQADV